MSNSEVPYKSSDNNRRSKGKKQYRASTSNASHHQKQEPSQYPNQRHQSPNRTFVLSVTLCATNGVKVVFERHHSWPYIKTIPDESSYPNGRGAVVQTRWSESVLRFVRERTKYCYNLTPVTLTLEDLTELFPILLDIGQQSLPRDELWTGVSMFDSLVQYNPNEKELSLLTLSPIAHINDRAKYIFSRKLPYVSNLNAVDAIKAVKCGGCYPGSPLWDYLSELDNISYEAYDQVVKQGLECLSPKMKTFDQALREFPQSAALLCKCKLPLWKDHEIPEDAPLSHKLIPLLKGTTSTPYRMMLVQEIEGVPFLVALEIIYRSSVRSLVSSLGFPLKPFFGKTAAYPTEIAQVLELTTLPNLDEYNHYLDEHRVRLLSSKEDLKSKDDKSVTEPTERKDETDTNEASSSASQSQHDQSESQHPKKKIDMTKPNSIYKYLAYFTPLTQLILMDSQMIQKEMDGQRFVMQAMRDDSFVKDLIAVVKNSLSPKSSV